jgi:hypothetical protein
MDPEVKEALAERDQVLRDHRFPDNPQWGNFMNGELCRLPRLDRQEISAGCTSQVGILSAPISQQICACNVLCCFHMQQFYIRKLEGIRCIFWGLSLKIQGVVTTRIGPKDHKDPHACPPSPPKEYAFNYCSGSLRSTCSLF